MKVKKVDGWKNYKKFDVEKDLNSALQNWKPIVRTMSDLKGYKIVVKSDFYLLIVSDFCFLKNMTQMP